LKEDVEEAEAEAEAEKAYRYESQKFLLLSSSLWRKNKSIEIIN